ncbi:MAG: Lrp/AsnC ligand binding domain-containing protein [Candidatus Lokiarchaeota archaeon]|nr:Lrp/AsnC ligand binding domain-containing protein [Candidatus Lokiarchaeota archaeon]
MDASSLKQPRFLIATIIGSNVVWGLIPLFAVPILDAYPDSTLSIVFIRFCFASIVMFAFVAFQAILNTIRKHRPLLGSLAFFQTGWKDLKIYLTSRNRSFMNLPHLSFVFVLGFFGVTLNVTSYFVGLRQLPLTFVLLGAPGGFIILAALYNVAKGKERLSLFKAVYIALMILALVLIVLAQQQGEATVEPTLVGIVALILNILSVFIYYVYVGRDRFAPEEAILKRPRSGNYRLMRTATKLAAFMAFGALATLAIVPACMVVPIPYLNMLGWGFVHTVGIFFGGAFWPQLLFMVVACTVLPNLLIFLASMWWDPETSLTFEAWTSILNVIDPITSITASVLAGFQRVDTLFLVLTVVVLVIAILLRFIHERETKINALIFLKTRHGTMKEVLQFLVGLKEIRKFFYVTGKPDIMIKATFGSIREYYHFLSRVAVKEAIKIKFDMLSFVGRVIT